MIAARLYPLAVSLVLAAGGAVGGVVGAANAQTVAIVHAHLFTVGPAGEIADATVIIKNGLIAAVGAGAAVPQGARVIDAQGRPVTPGLMAASTTLGASEIEGVSSTRDDLSGGRLSAAFDIAYGVNPASTLIPLARQGGVTRAFVTPSAGRGYGESDEEEAGGGQDAAGAAQSDPAAGLFAGRAAAVRLDADDEDPVFRRQAAVVADLGDAGARAVGNHAAALILLKTALEDARAYAQRRPAFEEGRTRAFALSRNDLEALAPVVEGRIPLLVRAHRASDLRQLLKIARELRIKLVIEGAEEGWRVAPDLAAASVPVLIDAEADLPQQFETLAARLDNAARLQKAGVLIAIEGSRDFDNLRQARLNAGTAVANGLGYADALAAVTLNPAKIWGVSQSLGSLEPGKEADVVIWSGDPLETTTFPLTLLIRGVEQPNGSRGLELRDRYAAPAGGLPRAYSPPQP